MDSDFECESKFDAFPLPESERQLWALDQIINARGVHLDTELISGALFCSETITGELISEAVQISGLDNPKSVTQLKAWLEEEVDEEIENLQKDTVKSLVKSTDSDAARRVLEIRQELAKTSVTKYMAMANAQCVDGRARGLLQFYGANRTGRWAGRLIQVQNLPRKQNKHPGTCPGARQTEKN